jgi:hypothetical protein
MQGRDHPVRGVPETYYLKCLARSWRDRLALVARDADRNGIVDRSWTA